MLYGTTTCRGGGMGRKGPSVHGVWVQVGVDDMGCLDLLDPKNEVYSW